MIQINMAMPKCCDECDIQTGGNYCPIARKPMDFEVCSYQRMPFCPLEEVPDTNVGKWTTERTQEHDGELYCSECGYEPVVMSDDMKYCPRCGRKMTMQELPKEET